ncbi:MAG: hypothetical protein K6A72_09525 [Lachnospiraceae bacterium]|nr:hypothetical protein [Lachnospiraceae bacterium]
MIHKALLLVVFLIVTPIALGIPWTVILPQGNRYRMLACFPLGYFIELAIFHILAVPFAFLGGHFSSLVILYSCIIAILILFSVWFAVKYKPIRLKRPRFVSWEVVYLLVFSLLLAWQVYNVAVKDTTYWSYDDAVYVTYSADAIRYDRIQAVDVNTGIAMAGITAVRALQSSLLFPGCLSLVTGISVTTMCRTILEVFDVLLAYSAYAFLASVVFDKKENGLIMLILLSVLHIFGHYSPYSITFRLLGPNYQGKAVLAASLFPFMFAFMAQRLTEEYDRKTGFVLMALSITATALSMFGMATFIINNTLVVVLSLFRKERKWRHLWYLGWGCIMPVLYGSVYFIYKYFIW